MTNNLEISNLSLLLSSVLLIVALLIDYKEKLGLGNDIFIVGNSRCRSIIPYWICIELRITSG